MVDQDACFCAFYFISFTYFDFLSSSFFLLLSYFCDSQISCKTLARFFFTVLPCSRCSEDWYGMLYSWADNKKKSTLMLSVFEPNQPFPWLGLLKNLGPAYELNTIPYQLDAKEDTEETPFPVPPSGRRSYHLQSNAVWIKSSGLQVQN